MKSQLEEKLEQLKLMFECPRLYLSNFFIDFRSQIDLTFVKKRLEYKQSYSAELNDESQDELNTNWMSIINRINKFESDCFKKLPGNKFATDFTTKINQQIELITLRIESFTSQDPILFDEIDTLIYDTSFQIEKNIFKNQSITFLDREKCVMQRLLIGLDYKTTTGKLVIIRNEYFNKKTFQMLNSLNTKTTVKRLTNEIIKCKHLKNTLEETKRLRANKQIDEIILDYKQLTELFNWYDCQIESLGDELFHDLNDLTAVYFTKNKLKQIDPVCFANLSQIRKISTANNQLATVDCRLFNGLISLQTIDLSFNQLEFLADSIFTGLVNLQHISASCNKISQIGSNLFRGLNKLKHIDLRNNKITRLDDDIFNDLNELVHVDLINNQIEADEMKKFDWLSKKVKIAFKL